ncbi:MAG: 3-dehydroquinate synthase [Candidatus Omnitrophica bacterium]|nr:3-dehydroquinate synthase [Candidatus Omnitrophota bacterium]
MKTVNVTLKEHPYKIVIGRDILGRLGAALKGLPCGKDAVVITSPVINRYHGAALASGLKKSGFSVKVFEVPEGEQSKSVRVAFSLMEKIARYDRLKQIFIVAFGGGVIGDLAGFVASTYKRGVPCVQVPTTLLAQIDSAIGGKTAVDLPAGKNLVGTFYQPKIVWSDVSVLSTLDKRQIRNGLAEAVKYGVIADAGFFGYIAGHYAKILALRPSALEETVLRCSRIKARVVGADEKETRGIRTILNFGHTVGHAVEAGGGYRLYHHGESVALGMRVAAEISCRQTLFPRREQCLLDNLLTEIGLPRKIRGLSLTRILRVMDHDKKFKAGKNRFVLARRIGKVQVVERIPLPVIQQAVRLFMA